MEKLENARAVIEVLQAERTSAKTRSKELLENALAKITPKNAVSVVKGIAEANSEADALGAVIGIVQAELTRLEDVARVADRAAKYEKERIAGEKAMKEFNDRTDIPTVRYDMKIK